MTKNMQAPCCDRSSACNTMNLRSSESSPQILVLVETIKEMCLRRSLHPIQNWIQKIKTYNKEIQIIKQILKWLGHVGQPWGAVSIPDNISDSTTTNDNNNNCNNNNNHWNERKYDHGIQICERTRWYVIIKHFSYSFFSFTSIWISPTKFLSAQVWKWNRSSKSRSKRMLLNMRVRF